MKLNGRKECPLARKVGQVLTQSDPGDWLFVVHFGSLNRFSWVSLWGFVVFHADYCCCTVSPQQPKDAERIQHDTFVQKKKEASPESNGDLQAAVALETYAERVGAHRLSYLSKSFQCQQRFIWNGIGPSPWLIFTKVNALRAQKNTFFKKDISHQRPQVPIGPIGRCWAFEVKKLKQIYRAFEANLIAASPLRLNGMHRKTWSYVCRNETLRHQDDWHSPCIFEKPHINRYSL